MKCKTRGCGNEFVQHNSLQNRCFKCMVNIAKKRRERDSREAVRRDKAKHRADKERVKKLSKWRQEAQDEFNRYIRRRDAGQPCISCGNTNPNIQYCAGHFKTRGAYLELAFDERNVHLQCNKRCNMELSGNIYGTKTTHGYIRGLEIKYGKDVAAEIIEYLESHHATKKRSIEDFKLIKEKYRAKARELERR